MTRIYDILTGKLIGKTCTLKYPVCAICFSSDNKFIINGIMNGKIRIIDLTGKKIRNLKESNKNISEC